MVVVVVCFFCFFWFFMVFLFCSLFLGFVFPGDFFFSLSNSVMAATVNIGEGL